MVDEGGNQFLCEGDVPIFFRIKFLMGDERYLILIRGDREKRESVD